MKNNQKIQAQRGSVVIPGGSTGVLLIHSLGGSPLELRLVANSLARQGYTVYCPVIPGLTFGTDVSGMSTWRDWYQAVEQAFDELKKHCDDVIIGGASAGAVLALRLAAFRRERLGDPACAEALPPYQRQVDGAAVLVPHAGALRHQG